MAGAGFQAGAGHALGEAALFDEGLFELAELAIGRI
jgi:hypothetical protein